MTQFTLGIKELQFELDKSKKGFCLSFKLMNYPEIKVISSDQCYIIEELNKIIEKVSKDLHIIPAYKKIESDKILLIIVNIDSKFAKIFAKKIYRYSQLYTNENDFAVYMNCDIASVEFPKITNKAIEICNLLNLLHSYSDNSLHYKEYDDVFYNVKNIKESSIKLNYLRKALAENTMVFAYQPIVDRATMEIHYYECLLRIPDKNNNLISVGPIIPDAENKGLIFIVDQIVLEMAVKELSANPDLILTVNISNIGIIDPSLLDLAENLLQTYDVHGRLIIEITETSFNDDYKKITDFINKLRKFGCKFALDDFGSGFTSFKQLQNLPIDIIKIDGNYVRNITSDVQSQYFVERLIKISEDLGIRTVAEFVENGEIAQFLISLKVDGMQGNFFSEASTTRINSYKEKIF